MKFCDTLIIIWSDGTHHPINRAALRTFFDREMGRSKVSPFLDIPGMEDYRKTLTSPPVIEDKSEWTTVATSRSNGRQSNQNNNRKVTSDNYRKNNNTNNSNKTFKSQPKKPTSSKQQGKVKEVAVVDPNPVATLMRALNQLGIDPAALNNVLSRPQTEPVKEPFLRKILLN